MSNFIDTSIELEYRDNIYIIKSTNKPLPKSRLERLRKLGIPLVYKSVWLARSSKSKIQAIALDNSGRKQYYYSKEWESQRESDKEARLREFMEVVPTIKSIATRDKCRKGWPRRKTMSYMLDIVREMNIRVGNKKYLDKYNSYGLTTLKKEHFDGKTLKFKGKHGVEQNIPVKNKQILNFLNTMSSLPEDWLMKYESNGKYFRVSAQDLNNYLHSIVPNFTVKDYRTWGANVTFLDSLVTLPLPQSGADTKRNISEALQRAADKLGNNKATSKKSYVMETLVEMYKNDPQRVRSMGLRSIT